MQRLKGWSLELVLLASFILGGILFVAAVLLLYWLFIQPIRVALAKAREGVVPSDPASNSRRIFWQTWARLMLYRSPAVIALGVFVATAITELSGPSFVRAKYIDPSVSVLGNMRAQIERYRAERKVLPGGLLGPDGSGTLQTFMVVSGSDHRYVPAVASWRDGVLRISQVADEDATSHVMEQLAFDPEDFKCKNMQPHLLFYRAFTQESSYLYAVGIFGFFRDFRGDNHWLNAG